MRLRTALVAATSLAITTNASAAGVFVADPPSSAYVQEIRAAVSVDPSGATVWVAARLAGAADHVVWIVPRAPGAAVDLATSAWLDALEDATAPRVLAPPTSACDGPAELVGSGDFPVGVEQPAVRRVTSAAALAETEGAWSFALDPADRIALTSSLAAGDELIAVRWIPREGASSTPVLRVRGAAAAVPMHLTHAEPGQPIDVTVSLIADARATAPFTSLVAIADADLSWPGGAKSYAAARDALLSSSTSARFVFESSSPGALTAGEWIAGAGKSPSAADAFLRRAALRGELAGDVGQVTAALAPGLSGDAEWSAPCARGDLIAGAACTDGVSLGEATLGRADDLAFALAGTPKARWVTRLSGRIPAGGRGKALSLAPSDGPAMPVLRRAGKSTCQPPARPGGGAAPGSGGLDPGAGVSEPTEPADEPASSWSSSSSSNVDVNVGCHTDGAESCGGDSSGSDGCSSDSSDTGDDGCSSDSSDTGDDGCSGESSDAEGDGCSSSDGGDEGSGCSGGDDGGSSGGGCSGGDGSSSGGCTSNGGGSGGDCAVARGKRRRPSKWAFFALALAFPLRRVTRSRQATTEA